VSDKKLPICAEQFPGRQGLSLPLALHPFIEHSLGSLTEARQRQLLQRTSIGSCKLRVVEARQRTRLVAFPARVGALISQVSCTFTAR
jgi:hypothetical protein